MPFVQVKCINCGTVLQVDGAKGAAVCAHCGKPEEFVIYDSVLVEYRGASTVTKVVVPKTVRAIGAGVFRDRSGLVGVTIPNSAR